VVNFGPHVNLEAARPDDARNRASIPARLKAQLAVIATGLVISFLLTASLWHTRISWLANPLVASPAAAVAYVILTGEPLPVAEGPDTHAVYTRVQRLAFILYAVNFVVLLGSLLLEFGHTWHWGTKTIRDLKGMIWMTYGYAIAARNSTSLLTFSLMVLGVCAPPMASNAQEVPSTLATSNGPVVVSAGPRDVSSGNGRSTDLEAVSFTNNDTSPLVAFVYEGNCGKVMHVRGYDDVALTYGPPLEVGKTMSIATVPMGCKVPLTAAVFADGRWLGNPSDLAFIRARRKAAEAELRSILKEVAMDNADHKFDADDLEVKIAKYKNALDPDWRKYPNREEGARMAVLLGLEFEVGTYRRLKGEAPGETTLLPGLEEVIEDWVAELSRTTYPKLRNRLVHRRQP
jgi:hypothetical protein